MREAGRASGELVAEGRVYFGLVGPREKIPQALFADRAMAVAARKAVKNGDSLSIVRTHVTVIVVQVVAGRLPPKRRPAGTH